MSKALKSVMVSLNNCFIYNSIKKLFFSSKNILIKQVLYLVSAKLFSFIKRKCFTDNIKTL